MLNNAAYCLSSYNMPLLVFVESSDALDCRVIAFSCSGREYYIFGIGTNQIRNMLKAFLIKEAISFVDTTCLSSIFNSLL